MSIPSAKHDFINLSEMDNSDESIISDGLNLRLGLPGFGSSNRVGHDDDNENALSLSLKSYVVSGAKRVFSDAVDGSDSGLVGPGRALVEKKEEVVGGANGHGAAPATKAQVVGWPPIRSYRKNTMSSNPRKSGDDLDAKSGSECLYVKVSMEGAPYLRKVDLNKYRSYAQLSSALEKMFSCFTIGDGDTRRSMDLRHGSEYILTFEDKDGDWMLVGDVPWEMFSAWCKRLRIMKSSEAIGLAPRSVEKRKNTHLQ